MMAGGWGWGIGPLVMLLFWVFLVAGVVWLAQTVSRAGDGDAARRILDERFARGDIDAEEYRARRDALGLSGAGRRSAAGVVSVVSAFALLGALVLSSIAWSMGGATPLPVGGSGWTSMMGPGWMMGPGPMSGMGGMTGLRRGPGSGPGMMARDGPASAWSGGAAIVGAPEVSVVTTEMSFAPSEIRLPANAPVNLTLADRGAVAHDLTIPLLGVRLAVGPGETRSVGLRALPAGRYSAYCSVPGHASAGMRALVVVE